ncbi:MAG: antitoxin HicB [Chloroflexi bacterium RBG_16_68_14]|nr:MAG: antitoxin HicB [Chloroflexi bacterium RBG_16_68_14]
MLTAYINAAMARGRYKIIEDGTYFGEIPGLRGVWANAKTLEGCRQELQEVLEDWLILKLRDGDDIPRMGRAQFAGLIHSLPP